VGLKFHSFLWRTYICEFQNKTCTKHHT